MALPPVTQSHTAALLQAVSRFHGPQSPVSAAGATAPRATAKPATASGARLAAAVDAAPATYDMRARSATSPGVASARDEASARPLPRGARINILA